MQLNLIYVQFFYFAEEIKDFSSFTDPSIQRWVGVVGECGAGTEVTVDFLDCFPTPEYGRFIYNWASG